jgi:Protein of unknown function/Domain of unknown function (DUF1835)
MRGLPMTKPLFHVAFTPFGAENLRDALRNAGRDDRVIGLSDDLRIGPIDSDDPSLRAKWIKHELGLTGWGDIAAESEWFWRQALSSDHRAVAWFSRRSAREYAGFLEWLWRRSDRPCEVVDLTNLQLPQFSADGTVTAPVASLAQLAFEEIYDDDLFEQTDVLTTTTRRKCHALWRQLRDENAALRILKNDGLVSSPVSFFDALLMSQASEDWRKVAMIVGMTRLSQTEGHVSDLFLAARVNALVAAEHLERQGRSAVDMRRCEVRLPQEPLARPASQGPGIRLDAPTSSMVNRVLTSPYLW